MGEGLFSEATRGVVVYQFHSPYFSHLPGLLVSNNLHTKCCLWPWYERAPQYHPCDVVGRSFTTQAIQDFRVRTIGKATGWIGAALSVFPMIVPDNSSFGMDWVNFVSRLLG